MKIILLYGPGEVSKRNEALKIKKQFPKDAVFLIDLKGSSVGQLETLITLNPLFITDSRLIMVEGITESFDLQKIKIGGDYLTLLLLASSLKADCVLIQSAKKMGARICLFAGEKEVNAFPFLDALIEQKKSAFTDFQKLYSEYGGMYLLSMSYYLLRRNILPLPPSVFMQGKIKSQKQKYKMEDWEKLYYLVLTTEFNIKSGVLPEVLGLTCLMEKIIAGKYGE